ncbi:hypothetical protein P171DRAFT_513816 [Karstenula rhodostoma CBS 690.94]|uniref:Uncharacterized protein n=1 Tax=Karstenula rhodostoma CBS 690.94 TaxID=1392251 RepID=A0A9P4PGN4_9PLEO|nr:hypothetical protein P171DRAFT_513816 [Karstenula rhodostoma CBS 690.94]
MAGPKKMIHAGFLWSDSDCAGFNAWQKKQTVKVSPVKKYISNAEEYHRYVSRPESKRSFSISSLTGYFLRPAEAKQPECSHKLHPDAPVEAFCPVCQVDHCIAFLDAITQAWENLGGPFREDYEPRSTPHGYTNLKLAWRAARLELWNLVANLEKQAIIENRLDSYASPAEHSDEPDDPLPTIYDAHAALARYRMTYKYPVVDVPHQTEQEFHTPHPSPKQKKEVHFDKDLKNGSTRKNESFDRKHPRYIRGQHAVKPGSEFENTACTDDTEFLLSQTKMFFTEDLGFHDYAEKPEHWPEFEGIAGCHPRWEEILQGRKTFTTWRSHRKYIRWAQNLKASGTDGVAIVMYGGKIVDFVVLRAPKEKEQNVVKRRASWVSLSDSQS